MSCGVGGRLGLEPKLLCLWCRATVVVAPIHLLAWEPPCSAGVALKEQNKTNKQLEFPSAETNLTSVHEDAGLIPSLAQWVKDLALPGAMVQVADMVWILCCCGCRVRWWLQLQFDP